ncbi:hypothetical protein [Yoonia litorea]|uniref:DUF4274 domain-containing protein n=1 Tax=Yoonia litorea TaxID=1123755 RepID=A0A1I6MVE8_9RHOB|nr:hypothetical protein [Yoonia litorea]SFS19508.1 hypothetical protein SAMN05444714_2216 [Yoonia litorea]
MSDNDFRIRNLLKHAPQDLWLDTIRRARSDAHNGLIHWMLSQPQCDFAVAAHAFYRSNPAQHVDRPQPLPARPGPDNLFAVVLFNWDTGSFRTHNLMVEAQDAHPRMMSRLNQKLLVHATNSLPFHIPTEFQRPQGGVPAQVPSQLSPDTDPRIWSLYADLGLNVPDQPPGLGRKLASAKNLIRKIGLGR